MELSKNQIDRLGERLKRGAASEEDLRLLDAFRRSFATAHDEVVRIIHVELGMEPTSRRAKSTLSIVDKLRRESLRLSQMQDIAGCRVVVKGIRAQGEAVQLLAKRFPLHTVLDRRSRPSHGYRAVHFVVREARKHVEVQLRTQLQHLWAQLSEKLSDVVDGDIKYGRGDERYRSYLDVMSNLIEALDLRELELHGLPLLPGDADRVWLEKVREIVQTPQDFATAKRNVAADLALRRMMARKEP